MIEQTCIHIRNQEILIDYRDLIRFSFFFQNENLLYSVIITRAKMNHSIIIESEFANFSHLNGGTNVHYYHHFMS